MSGSYWGFRADGRPAHEAGKTNPNGVMIPLITVMEVPLEGQRIQGLIGRDVLAHGILIYSGYTNTFSLSF